MSPPFRSSLFADALSGIRGKPIPEDLLFRIPKPPERGKSQAIDLIVVLQILIASWMDRLVSASIRRGISCFKLGLSSRIRSISPLA
jgi:hypothetical protein